MYAYISEHYFQSHYMLVAKYVFVIFLSLFVIKILGVHAHLLIC